MLIPVRTETDIRGTPLANYVLIAANVAVFMLLDVFGGQPAARFKDEHLVLHAAWPALHQFFTYQFIHDYAPGRVPMHLLGNMLFLWVFGNGVNLKMGNATYLMFYVSGGVFAGAAFALGSNNPILGASGAIAAVTTAYLALFPRSRVTVLYILFFIGVLHVPALLLIGLKIILWDNVIAPGMGGGGQVAYSAHLAGYAYGLVVGMVMLALRAVPRDQFDLLALARRWNQRRAFAAATSTPQARAVAQYGTVARPIPVDAARRAAEDARLDKITDLRTRIVEALNAGRTDEALDFYGKLTAVDPRQCLSERHQLEIARAYYTSGVMPQAAAAFERFLESYPRAGAVDEIRLLLGIIYARDLSQYSTAETHLAEVQPRLNDDDRKTQCARWLAEARAKLNPA